MQAELMAYGLTLAVASYPLLYTLDWIIDKTLEKLWA